MGSRHRGGGGVTHRTRSGLTDAGVKAEVVERATRQIEINRCIMVTGEGVVVAEPRR